MIYFVIVLLVIAADRYAKRRALANLVENSRVPLPGGFLCLILLKNSGAAFGILKGRQRVLKLLSGLLLIFMAFCQVWYISNGCTWLVPFSIALLMGGALGNFIDRLKYNYVVDFLALATKKTIVINLADIAIFAGAVIYIVAVWNGVY